MVHLVQILSYKKIEPRCKQCAERVERVSNKKILAYTIELLNATT